MIMIIVMPVADSVLQSPGCRPQFVAPEQKAEAGGHRPCGHAAAAGTFLLFGRMHVES